MTHEMRNCLEEARLVCASYGVPRAVAPWVVNVMVTHYCASTDAFAGHYCGESKGFETEAEALAWMEANVDPTDDRLHCELKGPPEPPAPPTDDSNDETVPF